MNWSCDVVMQSFLGTSNSVAEDAENFRCGGGLLDYVQILYGNKGSQQKYGSIVN